MLVCIRPIYIENWTYQTYSDKWPHPVQLHKLENKSKNYDKKLRLTSLTDGQIRKTEEQKNAISVDCLILQWPQPVQLHRLNKIRKKLMKKSQTDLFDERPHLVQWTTQWHIGAQQAGGKQWWATSFKKKNGEQLFLKRKWWANHC